ncbi:hypothetical protein NLZ12_24135 [Klebsiella pneumoniae]|nr:hypothetical protein [Klebsiella pneumoniae]UTJ51795.1 hypothetical protein NLZ12_24135 [Klebsiella pneumoniae]UTJ86822.1 hypothetical protein NLZ11_23950 [Klebsiella pneumoniae]
MAIYGFKGKIKKNFYLCAGAQKAAMSGNRSLGKAIVILSFFSLAQD